MAKVILKFFDRSIYGAFCFGIDLIHTLIGSSNVDCGENNRLFFVSNVSKKHHESFLSKWSTFS